MIGLDGQPMGVIQIDTLNQRARFTDQDLEVLASVASQAAISIDNAKMHEQVVAQRALQRDLELARRMQRTLLPSSPPQVPGYFFFDYYQAARQVGGDYYDYVPLPGGRYAVIVGDVAGKGVPAALHHGPPLGRRSLLARQRTRPRQGRSANQRGLQPARLGRSLRHDARRRAQPQHERTHHRQRRPHGPAPPPARRQCRRRSAKKRPACRSAWPRAIEYESFTHQVEPGDVLTIFTDGFSEAMNGERELYGLERLKQQLSSPGREPRRFRPAHSGRRQQVRRRLRPKRRHVPGLLRSGGAVSC